MLDTALIGGASAALNAHLLGGRLDAGAMRPFIGRDGHSYKVNGGRKLKTNAPALLQYDEWKDIDRTVIEVATDRLVGVADLMSRGLTHPLGSIGQTISLWDTSSDMTGADISMSGVTKGEEDTPAYETKTVPVPIIHKDFRLNWRRLAASRLVGEGIDQTASSIAARVVAEKSEDMLFGGAPIVVDGGTIFGYTTHPDRNTVDLAELWDNPATTGLDILEDVQAMLQRARDDHHFGPYVLYIPAAYEAVLDNDYNPSTSDTRTVRERLMALSGLKEIKVADRLAANNVVLVQMERRVVDLAIAQDITTVQWQVDGGMQDRFKVMAVWVPRIKADFDGRSGIVHLRPA